MLHLVWIGEPIAMPLHGEVRRCCLDVVGIARVLMLALVLADLCEMVGAS